jgi:hypothetical protein
VRAKRLKGKVMNIVSKTLIGSAGLFCFIAACSDTSNRPVETAEAPPPESNQQGIPVNAPVDPDDEDTDTRATKSAKDSIAEARCARESGCDNVGDGKKFSSTADCMSRIQDDWKEDLNARECPGGVNESELNECLTAIRTEECGSPFDTLERVAECASGQICIDD